jgi:GATA-binding protein
MLESLSGATTGYPAFPQDNHTGHNRMFDFDFDTETRDEPGPDFMGRTFMTESGPEQFSVEHPSLDWDLASGSGPLPWLSGLSGQFYTHPTLYPDRQSNTQHTLRGTNSATLLSEDSWDGSEDVSNRTQTTAPSVYDRAFKDGDDKQKMLTLPSSVSNSTSTTDFVKLSQNKETFNPSSPSPPNSPSDENASLTGFSSIAVPKLSSSELNPQSNRISRVSSVDSEKHDQISCSNCSTNTTSLWRRTREGLPICNACGLFTRLHGIPRPLSLKTDVVKKRKRDRASVSSPTGGKSRGSRSRATRNLVRGPSTSESKRG